MTKMIAYESPRVFLDAAELWQASVIQPIYDQIHALDLFEETIKWGNLVFLHKGAAILIRQEEQRVILGFFRGKRMTHIEPRLKPSGKYELANIILPHGRMDIPETLVALAQEAVRLNQQFGDPTKPQNYA